MLNFINFLDIHDIIFLMPIYESNRSIFSLGTYNKFNHSVKSNNILNKGLTPNPHSPHIKCYS